MTAKTDIIYNACHNDYSLNLENDKTAADKIALDWIRNAFPVEQMFNCFFASVEDESNLKSKIQNKSGMYKLNNRKIENLLEALRKAAVLISMNNYRKLKEDFLNKKELL